MSAKTVKCTDCGFLAVRRSRSRELVEVEASMRTGWHSPKGIGNEKGFYLYNLSPLCFRRAANLAGEAADLGTEPLRNVEVFDRERACDSFTPWEQGFTPKEHQEMINAKELRVLQQKAIADQRAFDEKARTTQTWQTAMLAGLFTILGVVLGVALG